MILKVIVILVIFGSTGLGNEVGDGENNLNESLGDKDVSNGKGQANMTEDELADEEEDEFYDYYGLDYGEGDEDAGIGDLLSDLGPDVLQTISPTLIVGFFESASPEDVKSILDNSEILLKLPPETIGLIVQKLPNELVIQIVNSEGVRNLFLDTAVNAVSEDGEKLKKFQSDVATILFDKLDIEVISSLPQILIRSQLENENLLIKLLNFPDKLLSILKGFPSLLNDVPTSVVISILQNNSVDLENIHLEFITQVLELIPAEVLSALFTRVLPEVPPLLLFSSLEHFSPENISLLVQRLPNQVIIKVVNSEEVKDFFLNTAPILPPEQMNKLEAIVADLASILFNKLDIEIISSLPKFLVESQLDNVKLLVELLNFPEKLFSVVRVFPNLLNDVPTKVITTILQNNAESLGNISPKLILQLLHQIPAPVLSSLITRVITHIPASVLSSTLSSVSPETITQVLSEAPPSLVSSVLENGSPESISRILSAVPASVLASSVASIPNELLLQLGSNSKLTNALDQKVIAKLLDLVSISQIKILLAHGVLSDPVILRKLPQASITRFAGNLELLSLISDKTLVLLSDLFPDLLSSVPASSAAHIARSRPWVVGMLPLSAFSGFSQARLEELLVLLSDQDLVNLLTFQPALVNIGAEFTPQLLSKFLQARSSLLGKLPPAAEPFISQLLVDENFIRKLPASLLARLAGSEGTEKLLTKFAIITILKVYPDLPVLVSSSQFLHFFHFLSDPWFRANIPCLTISLLSADPSLLEILPVAIVEKVISSRRILSCIPASNLEMLMEQRLRLSRLSMVSMLRSARQLPREKYSMGLFINFLRQQVC